MAVRKSTNGSGSKATSLFSEEEKAAVRDYVKERKAQVRGSKIDGEQEVLAKISQMTGPDKAIAQKLHALVRATAPDLTSRTWYGMPAYAKDGEVLCYFQPGAKFKVRYGTLGFSDGASLDEGRMWPVVYAITEMTPAEEAKIAALLKRALG